MREPRVGPGALICTGIPGPGLDPGTRSILETLRPSGIILFRRNVETLDQLRRLTAALRALPTAPLIAIDHEGGGVMRVGPPFTHFPPARAVAALADPQLAFKVGRAMGRELATAGIDVSFAPVLDVNSNPDNPIIGERAFGTTPESVTAYGLALMRGLHAGGVIPCGKHFPGHGDTDRDSHLELPVVRRSRAHLESTELAPFRAAVAAGIPMLMTAHVRYPTLDPDLPATLSSRILQGLLRDEMRFRGVIVSDDLEMRALSGERTVAEGAVQAFAAGVDWLLICNDLSASVAAAAHIDAAVEAGRITRAAVAAAAARIRHLRRPTRMRPLTLPVAAHAALNARIRAAAGLA